jgi:hypothetical protein
MSASIRLSLLLFAAGATVASAQEKITYQDHVRPILENRCLNCHNPDKKKGGLDLSTFPATMAGGSGGASIEPGDPQASKLFQVIVHSAEPFMPPKSDKLPQAEADVIAKWIQGGVLETASSTAKAKKKAEFAMSAGGTAGKPEGPPAMPEHLSLEPVVTPARPNAVTAMAHSPWAPLLALAAPKQVLLYHSETRELLGVLAFPEGGFPENVTFTRNGALVLASGGIGGKKGTVAVWDVKTGKRVITLGEEFDSIAAADITPDYRRIAIGSREKRVKIYDTASGQLLKEIKKHTDWLTAVAFSPDGVLLASMSGKAKPEANSTISRPTRRWWQRSHGGRTAICWPRAARTGTGSGGKWSTDRRSRSRPATAACLLCISLPTDAWFPVDAMDMPGSGMPMGRRCATGCRRVVR